MLEHGLSARPYDCSHCGLRFFFRAELDNHTLGHHAAHGHPRAGSGSGGGADDEEAAVAVAQASFYQHLSSLTNGMDSSPPRLDLHYYTVPPPPGTPSAPGDGTSKSQRKSPGRSNGRDRDREGGRSALSVKPRCLICGKELASPRALAAHLRSSHGVQDNGEDLGQDLGQDLQVCLLCKEMLPDRDALLVHLAVQHPAPGLGPLDAHMALLSQAHAQAAQAAHALQQAAQKQVKQELSTARSPSPARPADSPTASPTVKEEQEDDDGQAALERSAPSPAASSPGGDQRATAAERNQDAGDMTTASMNASTSGDKEDEDDAPVENGNPKTDQALSPQNEENTDVEGGSQGHSKSDS